LDRPTFGISFAKGDEYFLTRDYYRTKTNIMPFEVAGFDVKIKADCLIYEEPSTKGADEYPIVPTPPGYVLSNRIIQTDQPFRFKFIWNQKGSAVWVLDGEWLLEVFLEEMGHEEAPKSQAYYKETVTAIGREGSFKKFVEVEPNHLDPGVYRVVASMQFLKKGVPKALAGFDDVGFIRIIEEA
jgi:hypothetical protein